MNLDLFVPIYELLPGELDYYPPVSILHVDRDYNLFKRISEIISYPIHPFCVIIGEDRAVLDGQEEPLKYVFAGELAKNFEYNDKYGFMNKSIKLFLDSLPFNLHIILNWY